MPKLSDDALDTWRAFLGAHARVTKRISRDLADAGLPDLTWYDVLWTLYRADDPCASRRCPATAAAPTR
jgi:hypothetical protein